MSDNRVFVDTSVLVYAYDADAGHKHETAQRVVRELWESRSGAVSTQVLHEFYVTVTRKLPRPLTREAARAVIDTYRAWPVHQPHVGDVTVASHLEERRRLSFWDALVITSAQQTGARTLLSEELSAGQRFDNVVVVNPFGD